MWIVNINKHFNLYAKCATRNSYSGSKHTVIIRWCHSPMAYMHWNGYLLSHRWNWSLCVYLILVCSTSEPSAKVTHQVGVERGAWSVYCAMLNTFIVKIEMVICRNLLGRRTLFAVLHVSSIIWSYNKYILAKRMTQSPNSHTPFASRLFVSLEIEWEMNENVMFIYKFGELWSNGSPIMST